jgi:hypothetical protein
LKNLINKIKKFLKIERDIILIDFENRTRTYKTISYPEEGALFLKKDGKLMVLIINEYSVLGGVYNLQTVNGFFLLRYLD